MTRRSGQPSDRELPKAYLRLDPDIDHKHPDNGWDFIRLLCAANRQRPRGRFASRLALEALFGKAVVKRFYDRRDVQDLPDGRVYVPGWDPWQEGDLTVAERVRRTRHSSEDALPGNADARSNVTHEPRPAALQANELERFPTPQLTRESAHEDRVLRESPTRTSGDSAGDIRAGDALSRSRPRPLAAGIAAQAWLADNGAMRGQLTSGLALRLGDLVARHGEDNVIRAMTSLQAPGTTAREYIFGAENALNRRHLEGSAKASRRSLSDTDFDAGMIGAPEDVFASAGDER